MTAQPCSVTGQDDVVRRTLAAIGATLGSRGPVSPESVEGDFASWFRTIIRIGQAVGASNPMDPYEVEEKLRERLAPQLHKEFHRCESCGKLSAVKFSASASGAARLSCRECGHAWTEVGLPESPKPGDRVELVDHPAHYNSNPSGVEAIAVVEHMSFNVGSAMKYLWRHGLKPGADAVHDLKKAVWYVRREIDRLSKP